LYLFKNFSNFAFIVLNFTYFVFFLINSIIIVGNNIGADGAKFISEGIKENKVITVLDLRGMFVFILIFNFRLLLIY